MITRKTDWHGTLLTNTGAPARLVAGPDCFGNLTFEGDFGRGVERRYCSDNGVDVTSLKRFVRKAEPVRQRGWSPPLIAPALPAHLVGRGLLVATASRSAPAPA